MIAGLAPGEERSFARAILAARSEGRKLQPISNTRLISKQDAKSIFAASLDLRQAKGEEIVAAVLSEHENEILLSNSQIVESAPSTLVEGRAMAVVVEKENSFHLGILITDRLFNRPLAEDLLTCGDGIVSVVIGDQIPKVGPAQIRMGREKRGIVLEQVKFAENETLPIRVSVPLLPAVSWERGGDVIVDLLPESGTRVSFLAHRL